MLTRRVFASCALCAAAGLAAGFAATEVSAQGAAPKFTRKILQQTDGPMAGYTTVTVEVDLQPGALIDWHTHPGIEAAYFLDGSAELMVKGRPNQSLTPGGSFQIPPETPHALRNGSAPAKVTSTYIVEKGKPLASPAAAPT